MRSIRFIQNAATSAARPISLPEFANALFGALGPASINTVLKAEHAGGLTSKDDLKNGLREHEGHTSEQHSIGESTIIIFSLYQIMLIHGNRLGCQWRC